MKTKPIVLTMAGSDPCSGAGLQADLRVIEALGCYGTSVVTALTAQNTQGVEAVWPMSSAQVKAQAFILFNDICPRAIKVGMLGADDTANAVAEVLEQYQSMEHGGKVRNIVVDTILKSTSGANLFDAPNDDAMLKVLRQARIITPNLPEAQKILGSEAGDLEQMARRLSALAGGASVYLKGGHGAGNTLVDLFYNAEENHALRFEHQRIDTRNTHGTGCALSSAIAAFLAQGCALDEAARKASDFMQQALESGREFSIGQGHGPAFVEIPK